MRRMERKLDITGEQVGTSRPKSSEGWRKKALYNFSRTSEAAQERTLSSSDRDLKPDVDIASPSRRQQLRQQRWLENRGSSSVMSQSSESPRRWLQRQDSEVQSRPNERKSNTSALGQRKGGDPGESSKKPEESSDQPFVFKVAQDETGTLIFQINDGRPYSLSDLPVNTGDW